jgi:hypothetical protein
MVEEAPMDALTAGADIATIATGLSAVTAAYVWIMGRVRDRRQQKAAIAERNWHGYITPGGINGWDVRLAEHPDGPTSRVVLEVLGTNAENWADNMRQTVLRDGKLSRSPTVEEWEFLMYLYRERGYGKGLPIGYPDA